MVEKTLIVIITLVFLLSSWWWTNRQDATVEFCNYQLRERDAVINQLSILALPQVEGKTAKKVQEVFQNRYPQQPVRHENGSIFSGELGVSLSEDAVAIGFIFPWDIIKETPSQ